jgi:hypothetical protein
MSAVSLWPSLDLDQRVDLVLHYIEIRSTLHNCGCRLIGVQVRYRSGPQPTAAAAGTEIAKEMNATTASSALSLGGSAIFFLGDLDQYREKVQSLQVNSGLYAVRS